MNQGERGAIPESPAHVAKGLSLGRGELATSGGTDKADVTLVTQQWQAELLHWAVES